jgi:hypothetical protein
VFRGKSEIVRLTLAALVADGHVLLEDVPGVGKTTLALALVVVMLLAVTLGTHPKMVHSDPAQLEDRTLLIPSPLNHLLQHLLPLSKVHLVMLRGQLTRIHLLVMLRLRLQLLHLLHGQDTTLLMLLLRLLLLPWVVLLLLKLLMFLCIRCRLMLLHLRRGLMILILQLTCPVLMLWILQLRFLLVFFHNYLVHLLYRIQTWRNLLLNKSVTGLTQETNSNVGALVGKMHSHLTGRIDQVETKQRNMEDRLDTNETATSSMESRPEILERALTKCQNDSVMMDSILFSV